MTQWRGCRCVAGAPPGAPPARRARNMHPRNSRHVRQSPCVMLRLGLRVHRAKRGTGAEIVPAEPVP